MQPQKALSPIEERALPNEISKRRTQLRKAEYPTDGVDGAKNTWNKRSQSLKASEGMAKAPLVVNDRRLSQLEKAPLPNCRTLLGIFNAPLILEQPANAAAPMDCNVLGNKSVPLMLEQLLKADAPMVVSDDGSCKGPCNEAQWM